MDYGEYAKSRISKLREDFDFLSSLRTERADLNEQCRKEVLAKIALENPRLEVDKLQLKVSGYGWIFIFKSINAFSLVGWGILP